MNTDLKSVSFTHQYARYCHLVVTYLQIVTSLARLMIETERDVRSPSMTMVACTYCAEV